MNSPEVRRLFPTPVFVEVWPEAARWNNSLREAMLAKRASGQTVAKSNFLGWQSDIDMLRWGGDAATALRDRAIALCNSVTHDEMEPRPLRWHGEMWGNISGKGASNQTHAHPGAFWSIVYYVDDGYGGSDDRALGGELTFIDPRFPTVRMRTPPLRARLGPDETDHHEVWVRPRTGLIVIFPSWLQHAVRPYLGAGERMSIAINLTIFADLAPAPL
jgi:uncharacterized protein (TIGR02466 family)